MKPETWKPIPGFPGYKASDQGRIGSCLKCVGTGRYRVTNKIVRVLKPGYDEGYALVTPCIDGKPRTTKVATLVMLTFHGLPPKGLEICHADNNPGNNHLSNLRYDTHTANMQESVSMSKPRQRKLTLEQAEAARVEYAEGNISQRALAKKRGVSQRIIGRIVRGETYQDAGGPILGQEETQ